MPSERNVWSGKRLTTRFCAFVARRRARSSYDVVECRSHLVAVYIDRTSPSALPVTTVRGGTEVFVKPGRPADHSGRPRPNPLNPQGHAERCSCFCRRRSWASAETGRQGESASRLALLHSADRRDTPRGRRQGFLPAFNREGPVLRPSSGEDCERPPRVAGPDREVKEDFDLLAQAGNEDFIQQRDVLAAKMVALRDFLEGHMDHEEQDLVGCAKSCLSFRELRDLENRGGRRIPIKDLSLVLPWVVSVANDAERRNVMSILPCPYDFCTVSGGEQGSTAR